MFINFNNSVDMEKFLTGGEAMLKMDKVVMFKLDTREQVKRLVEQNEGNQFFVEYEEVKKFKLNEEELWEKLNSGLGIKLTKKCWE